MQQGKPQMGALGIEGAKYPNCPTNCWGQESQSCPLATGRRQGLIWSSREA